MKHPWSRESQEHDLESLQQHHPEMKVKKLTVHRAPFATRRRVQHQEEPYRNPEPDSAQVSQEQPESFQQAISRLFTIVRSPTETVETFSRFVHLSVL